MFDNKMLSNVLPSGVEGRKREKTARRKLSHYIRNETCVLLCDGILTILSHPINIKLMGEQYNRH